MNKTELKRHERRQKQRELKKQQKKQSGGYPFVTKHANRKSSHKTVAEEKEAIQQTTEATLDVYRQFLPGLLKKLSRIPDPRQPGKIKHQITVLMIYGILIFVLQIPSRRQANRELTGPLFLEHLRSVFPELEEMPHQDTLNRLLTNIEVNHLENTYMDMLRHLIRKKKFKNLLFKNNYLVAVDGTQKHIIGPCWDERYLRRKVHGKDDEYQYYAFVLEAVFIFSNGMVLPLCSEFLENSPELEAIESDEKWKQDSELKAYYRLAKRLKKEFPKLKLTLLLDGLYANGPVMEICVRNNWDFMIVLKDGSLPSVWQEVNALMHLDNKKENYCAKTWRHRRQIFQWANEIEYEYGLGKQKKKLFLHVVTCDENWEEIDDQGCLIEKTARHAWISSVPLSRKNVHERCNLAARKRWLHENNILKEKRQGYHYEHIFAHDFDAMRGYHYLMHIGRMLNEMALHSVKLFEQVQETGIQAFIANFRNAMIHRDLDTKRIRRLLESPTQLRLIQEDYGHSNWPAA